MIKLERKNKRLRSLCTQSKPALQWATMANCPKQTTHCDKGCLRGLFFNTAEGTQDNQIQGGDTCNQDVFITPDPSPYEYHAQPTPWRTFLPHSCIWLTELMHVTHSFVHNILELKLELAPCPGSRSVYLDVLTFRIEFSLVVLPVTLSADGCPIVFTSSRKHQPPPTPPSLSSSSSCAFRLFRVQP